MKTDPRYEKGLALSGAIKLYKAIMSLTQLDFHMQLSTPSPHPRQKLPHPEMSNVLECGHVAVGRAGTELGQG